MKKIALTLIAVSALGVAACSGSAGNNTTNQANSSGEAVEDTSGATNDIRENASVDANGAATGAEGAANGSADNGSVANGAAGNEIR